MSDSPILNPDGSNTTTIAEPGILNKGRDTETTDGQMLTTEALVEQSEVMMGDVVAEAMTMGEMTVVADASGEFVVLDEQSMEMPTAMEPPMVVEIDPLGCSMSAYVSADEAVLSATSVTPLKSAVITPVTPRREFLSAAESSPSVSGVRETTEECDLGVSSKRRVVGRKLAVVEDDAESQMSVTSDDENISTTASSSRMRNKGIKRGRGSEKNRERKYVGRSEERSSEEVMRKKKGKKKEVGRKDTPEELSDGKSGEPKGVVDLVFEDMSSSVLGGAIMEWANRVDEIRVKSRKFQGKLSGEMKKCVNKIKDGTALLVARSEATGDPQFLRMRNSELGTQLRESENENARLREQLRKLSLGPSPPRRKRRIEKVEDEADVSQAAPAVLATPKRPVATKAPVREEFPPLVQRPPRVVASGSGSVRVPPLMPDFSTAVCDSGTETGAEAYFTRHIKFLTAMREMEKQRRDQQGKEQVGHHEEKKKETRNVDRRGDVQDRGQKVGPRIISNVQVAPPYMSRNKEGAASSAISGSDAEWRVVDGRRKRRGGNVNDTSLPPFHLLPLDEEAF